MCTVDVRSDSRNPQRTTHCDCGAPGPHVEQTIWVVNRRPAAPTPFAFPVEDVPQCNHLCNRAAKRRDAVDAVLSRKVHTEVSDGFRDGAAVHEYIGDVTMVEYSAWGVARHSMDLNVIAAEASHHIVALEMATTGKSVATTACSAECIAMVKCVYRNNVGVERTLAAIHHPHFRVCLRCHPENWISAKPSSLRISKTIL